MSWYSKQIQEGILKHTLYIPDMKTAQDAEHIINRLAEEPWYIRSQTHLSLKKLDIITKGMIQSGLIVQAVKSIGYRVSVIEQIQPRSTKCG